MNDLFKTITTRPPLYEPSEKNIWKDAYISKNMLCAHLNENVDAATRKMDFVKKSTAWIADILPPQTYPHLLDLGCGPGVYTELFYRKGYDVSGIDFSARSVAYAKKAARKNKYNIHYVQGDYTKIDFGSCYNLITLIYCDFGVLSGATRKKLLHKIYASLFPKGVFLFDVFTPLRYRGIEEYRKWDVGAKGFWHENLCLTLQSFYRYDKDNTFLNQYVTVTGENAVSFYNVWEHTFTVDELTRDLSEAGFQQIQIFGDVTGKQYQTDDDTICIVAQK